MAHRRHHHRNPGYRHHRRHNPGGAIGTIVSAGAGAIAVEVVPGMFGFGGSGWTGYLAAAATAVGGGWLVKRFVSHSAGYGFMLGGAAVTVAKVIRDMFGPALGLSGYYASPFSAPTNSVGYPPVGSWVSPGAAMPTAAPTIAAVNTIIPASPFSERLRGRFAPN